jgi:hypothetical protein
MRELDLYPRARFSAYYPEGVPGILMCAECAIGRFGVRSVWRALHAIKADPVLESRALGFILREVPGAACTECSEPFWDQLPPSPELLDTEDS